MGILILGITFLLGLLIGSLTIWLQIRRYRKRLGLPEDPFEAGEQYFI